MFLGRLRLAQGDVGGALAILDEASQSVQQHHFTFCVPEVAGAQVRVLLHQGDVAAAAHLAQTCDLPIGKARVCLATGDAATALAALEPLRQQMEAKSWQDDVLRVMVLEAVALHECGDQEQALQLLRDVLAMAEPGGFVRTFVDEGAPMGQLLHVAAARGIRPDYTARLIAAFEAEERKSAGEPRHPISPPPQPLVEPLSQRELEVLQLVAQGLSNREISERLFIALDTVKGHNRRIYGKLQVRRRTEAIARARELGLL